MNSRCSSMRIFWLGFAWLPGFLGGCAILEKQKQGSQAESETSASSGRSSSAAFDQQELKELSEAQHNKVLSEGYSQLYDSASGLAYLDEFLVFKFESNATGRALTDLAEYAATLKGQLEQLAKDYPSLSLKVRQNFVRLYGDLYRSGGRPSGLERNTGERARYRL